MDRELFRQVRPARKFLGLAVIVGLLVTFATIAQMTFLSEVVSRVFLGNQGLGRVEELLFLLIGAVVVRAGLVWVKEVVSQRGAILVKTELRERLFAHLMKLGPAFTKNERTGELVSTAVEGVERLDAYFGRYLPQVALSALVPLSIFLYLMPVDWISGLLLLGTAPVIPILMIAVGKYAEAHIQRQWRSLSRMSAYFLDTLQGLTTLKVFGLSVSESATVASVGE
ncbi:MAG: ABC transporter transmembrane domain-containing protein, partial [Rubrobacteraceae bacterium]